MCTPNLKSFLFCLSIPIALNNVTHAVDPIESVDKVVEAFFTCPPTTIDITFRRHMSYTMPSQQRMLEEIDKRLSALQLERTIRSAPVRPLEIDRAKMLEEMTKGYEELKDRWIEQHLLIGPNSDFKTATVTLRDENDRTSVKANATNIYVQPSRDSISTITAKVAEVDRRMLRQGMDAAAAMEDFRFYGRLSHPMMISMTSMISGKHIPRPGDKMLNSGDAQKLLDTLKKNMRNEFTIKKEQLGGKEVFRVAAGVGNILWVDENNPNICYKRESKTGDKVIFSQEFEDFKKVGDSNVMYPTKIKLYRELGDGRTLNELTIVTSVQVGMPVSDKDLDFSPPEGWMIFDIPSQTVSRVENGTLVFVAKGATSVAQSGAIVFPAAKTAVDAVVDERMKDTNITAPITNNPIGAVNTPQSRVAIASSNLSYYLLAVVGVVFAIGLIIGRKTNIAKNPKSRSTLFLTIAVIQSLLAAQLASSSGNYLWLAPAAGGAYFLYLSITTYRAHAKPH